MVFVLIILSCICTSTLISIHSYEPTAKKDFLLKIFILHIYIYIYIPIHRWRQSSAGGWWKPVSHLHGCHHWLCVTGMWSHGNLHQMRKEDERVPHLQAVCCAGRACLQVLKLSVSVGEWVNVGVALRRGPSPEFITENELLCMTSHRA